MAITTIIILTILLFIFYKITHIIWKAIIYTLIILLVIMGTTTYLVYNDVQKIISDDKIIIISNENEVLTGAIFSNNDEKMTYLDQNEIDNYSILLGQGNMGAIKGEKYILARLDISNLSDMGNISYSNITMNLDEVKQLMLARTLDEFPINFNDLSEFEDDQVLEDTDKLIKCKMRLSMLLMRGMMVKSILFDNLSIYPERITSKLIEEFPKISLLAKNKLDEHTLKNG